MKIKSITIDPEEIEKEQFRSPSNFYILNALGEYVFYQTRSRATAQQWADEEYGIGKYKVRSWKI